MNESTGKLILRQTFAHLLPPEVTRQSKQGFGVPVGHWLRHDLAGWTRQTMLHGQAVREVLDGAAVARVLDEHAAGKSDHGKRIWALLCLEMWQRRYDAGL